MSKLVRDDIPDIIRADGLDPIIHVADDQEFAAQLRAKLTEEVDEFLTSDDDLEELADILEVLHALAQHIGSSPAELRKLRAAKAAQRGGFAKRLIWSGDRRTCQTPTMATDGPVPEAMSGFAPCFPVRDMRAALAHYERLGFEVMPYTEGITWAWTRLGPAELHLFVKDEHDPGRRRPSSGKRRRVRPRAPGDHGRGNE